MAEAQITKYRILKFRALDELEQEIRLLLTQGWQPYGPLTLWPSSPPEAIQVMTHSIVTK